MAIRYGAKGAIVVQLQQLLNGYKVALSGGQWVYPNLKTDGDYGPKTADAVRNYRMQRGLSYDGNVVDDQMWRMLTGGGFAAGGSIGSAAGGVFGGAIGGSGASAGSNNAGGSNNPFILAPPNNPNNPNAPFDWKKYEKYFLYGGIALIVLFATRD